MSQVASSSRAPLSISTQRSSSSKRESRRNPSSVDLVWWSWRNTGWGSQRQLLHAPLELVAWRLGPVAQRAWWDVVAALVAHAAHLGVECHVGRWRAGWDGAVVVAVVAGAWEGGVERQAWGVRGVDWVLVKIVAGLSDVVGVGRREGAAAG